MTDLVLAALRPTEPAALDPSITGKIGFNRLVKM
jgi:hypothetical protein